MMLARGVRAVSEKLKFKLHPHSLYVTQASGEERPFTGRYWNEKTLGNYSCVVCSTRLFSSNQKFYPTTGFAAFWNSERPLKVLPLKLHDPPSSKGEIRCSGCSSHLGHLFEDGPPPSHNHFQVKSASLKFVPKPEFVLPQPEKKKKKKLPEKQPQRS
jgi:peptide-methionine (R)-S-oxide reductase